MREYTVQWSKHTGLTILDVGGFSVTVSTNNFRRDSDKILFLLGFEGTAPWAPHRYDSTSWVRTARRCVSSPEHDWSDWKPGNRCEGCVRGGGTHRGLCAQDPMR